ncbi:SusC/RagA family TonB-linked outer membrane protein [Maribellus maritimus]|uniref:SusC/RagA family TonB-linked outer membrane protein n=1 Tax=Maribellus maritimus TaxID=2870838 RepID=UPI001EECC46C|nr:SusC/RagA family TonB-linked outer membrane protein [Maribellus maritimus]MCG6189541.1 SusC/RagA family TonB-linked outer membrane protein [Maribellus maritimus]
MKLTFSLILISFIGVFASESYSQTTRLTLSSENLSLEDFLIKIENQSEFRFFYTGKIDVDQQISGDFHKRTITEILDEIAKEVSIKYEVMGRQIILSPADRVKELTAQQPKSVSGKVTDPQKQPLPGVTVIVKGTTQGTVTNADGEYSLSNVTENVTLQFSFVGMSTQEIEVGNRNIINVIMVEEAIGLEEVVAVGYGVQKKINLTGAVESVSSEKIDWKPVGQTSMALQGVAPGVTITQNSGQPGKDGGTIRIRGIGTLGTAGQDPLVLIDGVEGKINTVDPNDIEDISILKDASSAAIYGSRAANGVIIITTKRAENKKISVNYNGYVGWQSPTDLPKQVSGLDHMLLLNEANTNLGQTPTFLDSYIEAYKQNAPSDLYPDTNWQKLTLTNNGLIQNHSLDVSGGNDLIKIRGSVIHFEQNGLIPNTGYSRNSVRLNTDLVTSKKLNFKFDLRVSDELQYEPSVGVNTVFFHMNGRIPANQEGLLSDGRYGQGWLGANPISYANDSGKANNRMFTTILNMQGEWKPIEGMNLSFMYAPEFYYSNLKEFTHTINTYYGDGSLAYVNPNKSSLLQRSIRTKTDNIRALLNYTKKIKHNSFAILAGFEQIEYIYESFQGYRENFPLENYQLLSLGSEVNQQADGSANEYALRSYFGRFNYNFKEKYLFEANLRYDGSSRFASGNKYGWFPSFSAGWRISEENFLSNYETLDNLKLRVSWGELGNQNIGNYPFASSVDLTKGYILDEVAVAGASLTELGNTDISWETTQMFDVGLNIGILNKFAATADFYVKNTNNILLQLPIPMTVGLSAPYQNAGKVRNTGWDISISHFNRLHDFKYEVSFTLSDVKNEIIDLKGTGPYISSRTIRMEGQPIDAFYGYKTDGLFQTQEEVLEHAVQFGGLVAPGDIKYIDQPSIDSDGDGKPDMEDGVITPDGDRVILGSSIPRYTYSLNLSASYKGFDLNAFLQGVGKANGYLDHSGVWAFYVGSTAMERHLDRWTPQNTDASYPRLTFNYPNNEQVSDYWMLDASYLRMKNIQIGYSFPQKILEKTFMDSFRLYVSGQNLFTIDNFLDGFDVESPVGNSGFYPVVKTFTFGINAKF